MLWMQIQNCCLFVRRIILQGNNMNRGDVETVLNNFKGIVIIDEAYINYSRQKTFIQELTEYPNLIVMQTLSKAWGLAALRMGIAVLQAWI